MSNIHFLTSERGLYERKSNRVEEVVQKYNKNKPTIDSVVSSKYRRIWEVASNMHANTYNVGKKTNWENYGGDGEDKDGRNVGTDKRKNIIFSHFDMILQTLKEYFAIKFCVKSKEMLMFTGNEKEGKDRFLTSKTGDIFDKDCVIFINMKSGATGLNLQCASGVIFADVNTRIPAEYQQAIARCWRLNQTRDVRVAFMVPVYLEQSADAAGTAEQGASAANTVAPTIESLQYESLNAHRKTTQVLYKLLFGEKGNRGNEDNDEEDAEAFLDGRNMQKLAKAYFPNKETKGLSAFAKMEEEERLKLIEARIAARAKELMQKRAAERTGNA